MEDAIVWTLNILTGPWWKLDPHHCTTRNGGNFKSWHYWEVLGSLETRPQRELSMCPALLHSLTTYSCCDGPPTMTDTPEDRHSLYKWIVPSLCSSGGRLMDTGSR